MRRRTLRIAAVVLATAFALLIVTADTMTAAEYAALPRDAGTLLDVRLGAEHRQGHIEGSVHANVLSPGFFGAVRELPRDEPVYAYCAHGPRAGLAVGVLRAMGFRRVVSVGGYPGLVAAGLPVRTEAG